MIGTVLFYGAVCWATGKRQENTIRTEMRMLRWTSEDFTEGDKNDSAYVGRSLLGRRCGRQGYGGLDSRRREDEVVTKTAMEVEGSRGDGGIVRGKNLVECGVREEDASD